MQQYFAVRSASGALIGVWEDLAVATETLKDHPNGTMRPLVEVEEDQSTRPRPTSFQDRVHPWMQACFSPEVCVDPLERGDLLGNVHNWMYSESSIESCWS